MAGAKEAFKTWRVSSYEERKAVVDKMTEVTIMDANSGGPGGPPGPLGLAVAYDPYPLSIEFA